MYIKSDIVLIVFIVDTVVLLVNSWASHSSNTVLQHYMITWIFRILICFVRDLGFCFCSTLSDHASWGACVFVCLIECRSVSMPTKEILNLNLW